MTKIMKQNKKDFSMSEIKEAVTSCQNIILWLGSTDLSVGIKYKRMDDNVRSLMNIECIFAYLYTEVGKYGNISDIIDTQNEIYARYTLVASLVFTEPKIMQDFLKKLPVKWADVMDFVRSLTYNEKAIAAETLNKNITNIDKAIKKLPAIQIIPHKNEVWC